MCFLFVSYYNNFYEGVFTLYKHKYLPYEVQMCVSACSVFLFVFGETAQQTARKKLLVLCWQVQAIYQRCSRGSRATCNCGVAVRSGDFVFFADRCRRKAAVCRGSHRRGCGDLLETYSYEWDSIPAGTRVFRHNGGRDFEVSLPNAKIFRKVTQRMHFLLLNVSVSST